jgi:uncharacterized peroxidase-related enzyme
MRLAILDNGHGWGKKLLFAIIRVASRHPVLDVIKLVGYRADFYGDPMQSVTQSAMRGPSPWSIGDRELMAAVVARANECEWCVRAHGAVAAGAYSDEPRVMATLSDLDAAPIEEPLRATLGMLRKLTRVQSLQADDVRALLSAGVTREQIEDALAVAFAFNVVNRLADTFGFALPTPEAMKSGAKYILARGYR